MNSIASLIGFAAAMLTAAIATGCATPALVPAGTGIDGVRQRFGEPTLQFELPAGGQRLLYATGPYGRSTYRMDFDAEGRLVHAEDVRNEAHFNGEIHPGMTTNEVLRHLGPPSYTWAVRYHDQTVWSYRYDNSFCRVFSIGITPGGVVEDSSYGADPACERRRWFGF